MPFRDPPLMHLRSPTHASAKPTHPSAKLVALPSVSVRRTSGYDCVQQGVKELTIPDVKLTRSKDGSSGTATFVFNEPAVFEASGELGDITGLYLIDAEGELSTVDVQVRLL